MLQAIFDKIHKKDHHHLHALDPNPRRASMPQVPAMQRRGSSNSLLTTPASGSKPGSRRGSMVNVRHDSIRAQGRWKTLASTLKKIKGKSDKDELIKAQPFRFPAFDVIEIRPDIAPTNLMDRLWLRVTAPSESNVDVKVKENILINDLITCPHFVYFLFRFVPNVNPSNFKI